VFGVVLLAGRGAQRELSRSLGVEWTAADRHGNRELQGVPKELLRAFSKRSDQIDLEVERLEADGRERTPRLVKWAVQATRKPKQHEARTPSTAGGGRSPTSAARARPSLPTRAVRVGRGGP
jgi:hypothetical protein